MDKFQSNSLWKCDCVQLSNFSRVHQHKVPCDFSTLYNNSFNHLSNIKPHFPISDQSLHRSLCNLSLSLVRRGINEFFQSCTVSIQDLPISCQLRSPNGSVSVYRTNTDFSVFPQLRFIWAQTQRIITVLPAWALGFDCSEWVGNGMEGGSQRDRGHELNTSIPVRCTVTWQHCLGRFRLISDSLAWAEGADCRIAK